MAHYNLGVVLREQNDVVGAIASFQKAIQLDPQYAPAHYNLGNALHAQKNLEEAIASYQKAIALDPQFARAHNNVGSARLDQKKPGEAGPCFRKALEIDSQYATAQLNLGIAFIKLGQFAEALKELQLSHELGSRQPGLNLPTAKYIKVAEQLLTLDQLLTAVLAGQVKPKNAAEQLELADLCRLYKQLYVASAQFFAAAFAADPKTAEKLNGHRYHAAAVAALAGASQGKDADKLGPAELAKCAPASAGTGCTPIWSYGSGKQRATNPGKSGP